MPVPVWAGDLLVGLLHGQAGQADAGCGRHLRRPRPTLRPHRLLRGRTTRLVLKIAGKRLFLDKNKSGTFLRAIWNGGENSPTDPFATLEPQDQEIV